MTTETFSLVTGGPLHRLWRWARLSDDALDHLPRRIAVCLLVAWLPLVIIAQLQGGAWGGSLVMPFFRDYDCNVRFLIVVPLLLAAEPLAGRRLPHVVGQFLQFGLIPPQAKPRFAAAQASARRLSDSTIAEVVLLAVVYGVGVLYLWRHHMALPVAGWFGTSGPDRLELTPAGQWFVWISLPMFQFLLLRWYWRLVIWARFLWQVSRIELALVPTHPDRCAGLGFLSHSCSALLPIAVAHGALLAGQLANRIFYAGARLPQFRVEVAALIGFAMLIIAGPLAVFVSVLHRAKRKGLREYGVFAQRYVIDFERKWLRGGAPEHEAPIGSADIQSLADLGNSYATILAMKATPIWRDNLIAIIVATLLPLLPLALTLFSLSELVDKALELLR